jgi:hypothetical protein
MASMAGIAQVEVRRDNQVVEVPLPGGALVRRPLTDDDFSSLLAPS